MDDYAGNMQDPQSLHKYLYVHNNPINAIDPSGMFMGFSIGGVMTAVVIGAVLIFAAAHFYKQAAFRSIPRAVNITISVNTNGKPGSWDTSEIERRLKEMLSPCFRKLRSGQSVNVKVIEESQASRQLGWYVESGLKIDYYGRVDFQKPMIPVILIRAFAYTQNARTLISTDGAEDYIFGKGLEPDYPVFWTNMVAHEAFWLGACEKHDTDTVTDTDAGDITSKEASVSQPIVVSPESCKSIIRALQLGERK